MKSFGKLRKEACWTGYKAKGMKKKGDRMVPNCVPEEVQLQEEDGYPHEVHVRNYDEPDDEHSTFPKDHINYGVNMHHGTYKGVTPKGYVFGFREKQHADKFVQHVNTHKHTHAEHLEDVKTDVTLHKVVERLIDMRHKGILTMDDYTSIAHLKEEVELDEKDDSPYEKASDTALDKKYGYGTSYDKTPKNSFGRAANRSSAAAALKTLRKNKNTDLEIGADAVHKGWAKTAMTSNDQTPEKKEKRAGLASTSYSNLPNDEKEKDRVAFNAVKSVYNNKIKKEEVELDESAGDRLLQTAREYKHGSIGYHKSMIKYHDHMADVHYSDRPKRKEHEENIRHHQSELDALKEEVEQIQEIGIGGTKKGRDALKRYRQKAILDKTYSMIRPSAPNALDDRKWKNRHIGILRATKKLGEDGIAVPGPTNTTGSGAVAGMGQPPGSKSGEPGVHPMRKRKVVLLPMGRRTPSKM